MANSLMAELPPINGLYVAFFAVIVYVFLGTSQHLSLGTHGVISIMVGSILLKHAGVLYPNEDMMSSNTTDTNKTNINFISNDPIEAKIMIATSLTLLTGFVHVKNIILIKYESIITFF